MHGVLIFDGRASTDDFAVISIVREFMNGPCLRLGNNHAASRRANSVAAIEGIIRRHPISGERSFERRFFRSVIPDSNHMSPLKSLCPQSYEEVTELRNRVGWLWLVSHNSKPIRLGRLAAANAGSVSSVMREGFPDAGRDRYSPEKRQSTKR
jgi:hypothetical protein